MSKSALYAGLGQGLMSLGKNVGEAYRMKAIEELRQQNLEQNWARQDKLRAEDRAYDAKKTADQRAYAQTALKEQRAYTEGRDKLKYEQDLELAKLKDGTSTRLPDSVKEQANSFFEEAKQLQETNPERAAELWEQGRKILTRAGGASNAGDSGFSGWLSGNGDKDKTDSSEKEDKNTTTPPPTSTPSPTITDKPAPTKEERDPYDLSQNTFGLMVNGGAQAVQDIGEGIGNWFSENDVINEVWKNPKAVESLSPQQLTMLIERKGNQPQWQPIIKRAQATLQQYQG